MRARTSHARRLRSRQRQLHFNPADPEAEALNGSAEGNFLDDPEDPDDPLLEPVLHRGPHENGDATKTQDPERP